MVNLDLEKMYFNIFLGTDVASPMLHETNAFI